MRIVFSLIVIILSFFNTCQKEENPKKTILLSKDTQNKRVKKWLLSYDSTLNIIILYKKSKDSINYYLSKASGVIITGGEDVNPQLYKKNDYKKYCGKINKYRDSLELKMINYALLNNIPVLGICRGLQIMNVSQGGTLIPDIPKFLNDTIHRGHNGHVFHDVYILKNSFFSKFTKSNAGKVYSNHHQAIDSIAKLFNVAAFASDSVIEAIELKDTLNYNFAIAIQWHPEAMDYNKDFSKSIAKVFLKNVNIYFSDKYDNRKTRNMKFCNNHFSYNTAEKANIKLTLIKFIKKHEFIK